MNDMHADFPALGLDIRTFNWPLRHAREAKGLSRAALARACGSQPGTIGDIEALKKRASERMKIRIALALETPIDDLFPEVLESLPTTRGAIEFPISEQNVLALAMGSNAMEAFEEEFDNAALGGAIAVAMAVLLPRERLVLEHRFGLNGNNPQTLEEVGSKFGVSLNRARQIEAKALHKLRSPTRSRILRPYADTLR